MTHEMLCSVSFWWVRFPCLFPLWHKSWLLRLQVHKYLLFYQYLTDKICIKPKTTLSALKLLQLLQTKFTSSGYDDVTKIAQLLQTKFTSSGYDDVTKIAHTSVPQQSRSMRRKVCGSTFLNTWHSETVPWKSTKNWNRCIERHLVQMILLAGGVNVFKAVRETSEMSQSLKDQTLSHTRIAPSRWGMQ